MITNFKKCLLILSLALLFPAIGFSQIQGSVLDNTNQPLSYASIKLLNKSDSSFVSGVMATEEGTYNITNLKTGEYLIKVSSIGYKSVFSEPFSITNTKEHKHIAPIVAEEESQQVQSINVIAKKPLYELQIDRMVVNVENSISSEGNSALEVLEKSPGVIVDRQNSSISMGGKDGVVVMINGKQNRMPMEAAYQLLNSLSSDNIKKIELITTPPAKYDADGNAGIINVILKKNEAFGTNGSFKIGAGVATHEKMESSLTINHHIDKVNYFGSYNTSFDNARQQINSYRRIENQQSMMESNAISKREAIILFQNLRMGFDYTLSSKTILSALVAGYVRDWDSDALNKIDYLENQVLVRKSNLKMEEQSKWIHGMGNINLQHSIKEDEILDFNLDILNYYNNNPSDYHVEKLDNLGEVESGEEISVTKVTPINILVTKVDYSKQVNPKLKVEGGLKSTLTFFKNNVGVDYFISGNWTIDKDLTNNYSLNENVSAAYSTISYNMTDKTSMVGGLRYEYMNSVLNSETKDGIVDLHYGEFFPSLFFSHKLNSANTIQLSYSRRIDRPTFNELAPFIVFLTPETFVSGNENLLPAFSNLFKAEYQIKRVMFSVTYTDTKNAIARFQPKYSEDQSKQYFISRNFDHAQTTAAMLAIPVTVTDWWDMQNNITGIMQNISTNYDGTEVSFSQNNFRINSIQRLRLGKRFSAEVAGYFQSRSLSGVYVIKPLGRLDLGFQYKLKNENSKLNLNISDVFKTSVFRSEAHVPDLNIYTNWMLDFEPRVLRLTFTHNFGNLKVDAARKRNTASEEERQRISN